MIPAQPATHRGYTVAVAILLGACISACSGSGKSASPNAKWPAEPCTEAHTQRELTTCWSHEATAAESVVEAEAARLADAMGRADPIAGRTSASEAHESWLRYRDAACTIYRQRADGGSSAELGWAICRWRLARERGAELRAAREIWN